MQPWPIVMAQRFAHREANQPGTVALVSIPLITQLVELHFGDRRKPASKVFSIFKSVQLGYIGYAIVVVIQ